VTASICWYHSARTHSCSAVAAAPPHVADGFVHAKALAAQLELAQDNAVPEAGLVFFARRRVLRLPGPQGANVHSAMSELECQRVVIEITDQSQSSRLNARS
jgi:hypothetical protein